MRLQEILNKIDYSSSCVLTIKGLCSEMPIDEYEDLKKMDYWKDFRNRKVKSMDISWGNYGHSIVLTVHLIKEDKKGEEK